MRAALISMAGQPRDSAGTALLAVAGKTLARRQLDFALAAGCERVIVLGHGGSAEAIALAHAAEDAGAGFQAIGDTRGLPGAVRSSDELLVFAPGLLAEASEALPGLSHGSAVLVLPAGAGVSAGFERIDLDRAWAGAAVVPGALVERLSELPPDIEPASALMRAALQARVPEHRLSETPLAEGRWSMLGPGADPVAGERAWFRRHSAALKAVPDPLGPFVVRSVSRLLAAPRSVAVLAGAAAVILAGAVVAASFGPPALGFALIALAVLLAACANELGRLRAAPFGQRRPLTGVVLAWLIDLAIVACAVAAIEGDALHRLFPPLVLLGAMHIPGSPAVPLVVRNRALLAAILALAAGFGAAESAIMLAALGLLALKAVKTGAKRG